MAGILMPYVGILGQASGLVIAPNNIPNLSLWYNPDVNTASKVTVNGSNEVTQILDLSGSGHPANSLNARYPDYATNVLNGLGGVLFNGVDDNSDINPIAWAHSLSGFTVYTVARPTTVGAAAWPLTITNENLGIKWNGTAWQVGAASGLGTVTVTNNTATAHIYGMIFDGSATGNANRLRFRYDRAEQTLDYGATTVGTATSGTASTMYFCGNRRNAPTEYMAGYLFEVLIWTRALNANEITGTEAYIQEHWGI